MAECSWSGKWADAPTIPTGEETAIWSAELGCIDIAFAPNAQFLWMAEQYGDSPVSLIDLQERGVRATLPGAGRVLSNFAVSGGQKLAAATFWNGQANNDSVYKIVVWDAAASKIIVEHPISSRCFSLAVNPVSRQIAWGEENAINLLDLGAAASARTIAVKGYPMTIAFSPDGKRLGTGQAQCIVCDVAAGKVLFEAKSTERMILQSFLALDPEGRAFVSGIDFQRSPPRRCILRFSADGDHHEVVVPDLDDKGMIGLSPNCRLAAITMPGDNQWKPCGIDIWDLASANKIKQLPGHWSMIGKVRFSSDSRRLASMTLMPDVIKIWSLADLDPAKPSP